MQPINQNVNIHTHKNVTGSILVMDLRTEHNELLHVSGLVLYTLLSLGEKRKTKLIPETGCFDSSIVFFVAGGNT